MTLTGGNTYTGVTIVNAGTLAVNGSLWSGGLVAVLGGALGGTGSVGTVHVYNGGALAPGYTAGAGTLTAASVTLDGGSVLDYTLVAPITSLASSGNSFLNVAGPLTLPPAGVTTLDVANGGLLGPGTYPLIAYSSLSGGGLGALSLGFSLPAGETSTFAISATSSVIDLVITAPPLVNGQWGVNSGGTWSTAGNWSGGNVPGLNPQDTAVFGTILTSGTAYVTLDSSRSLSSLGFNTTGANSYVIAASNGSGLTMSNTGGAATISSSVRQPRDRRADHAGQQPERDRRARQHADGQRGDRRRRQPDARCRRRRDVDSLGEQHLRRRDDRQRQHARDRQRRQRRGPGEQHHHEQQRHGGVQSQRRTVLQRRDQRQRAVDQVGTRLRAGWRASESAL